jgi:hypothetical protein
MMMLQEMICDKETMQEIAKKTWKGCIYLATNMEGNYGGMTMLWNSNRIIMMKLTLKP